MSDTLQVSLSEAFHNKALKEGVSEMAHATSFQAREVTVEKFIAHVTSGGAWAPATFKGDYRKRENFIQAQILALDLDNGPPYDTIPNSHAALLHATPGHTDDAPKTRIVFILDRPIGDATKWELAQKACLFMHAHWHPDPATKDCARYFYGSDKGHVVRIDKRLTLETVAQWVQDYKAAELDKAKERETAPANEPTTGRGAEAYAEAALRGCSEEIRRATEGTRHEALKVNAARLIAMAYGEFPGISLYRAEAEIRDSARATGLPDTEVSAMIQWCRDNVQAAQLPPERDWKSPQPVMPIVTYKNGSGAGGTLPQTAPNRLIVMSGIEAVKESSRKFQDAYSNPRWIIGLRSHLDSLDRHLGGFAPGGVYTFLGETGSGKTTLCASLAYPFVGQGKGIIVSCENSPAAFVDKMVAYALRRPYGEVRRAGQLVPRGASNKDFEFVRFTEQERDLVQEARQKIYRYMSNGTVFTSGGSLSPVLLMDLFVEHGEGVKWAVVDSLNNIITPGLSEYENVTAAAHTCEWLAVKHDIPIIATAQGGRNTKGRSQKRLLLHDGRGSGAIEEKGFAVIAIYNQWMLEKQGEIVERDFNPHTQPGHIELIIRKLRDGEVGKAVQVRYIGGAGFYASE